MNDRELLELAAKAAGTPGEWGEIIDIGGDKVDLTGVFFVSDFPWDPLEDDGAALRLAVKLCLRIWTDGTGVVVESSGYPAHSHEYELAINNAGDIYSATRRAIVRAAAEIGRAM